MKIGVSFVVQRREVASHHTDLRFSKLFDVDWPGRPSPGEYIDLDVGPPGEDEEFKVRGVSWSTETPVNVYLEPIIIPDDEQEQLDGYISSVGKKGWKVTRVHAQPA
jgi:hypothetical protein